MSYFAFSLTGTVNLKFSGQYSFIMVASVGFVAFTAQQQTPGRLLDSNLPVAVGCVSAWICLPPVFSEK